MSILDIIDPNLLKELKSCSFSQTKIFNPGDYVYREGEKPQNIYLIEDGLVGLVNVAFNGQETLLRVFGKHYIFGHRSLVAEENYHASSLALRKTKALTLCFHSLEDISNKSSDFLAVITKILAKELKYAEMRLAGASSKKVTSRIIESLIFLKNRYPEYKWTRREIGEFCGAQTETVTRALTKLEKEGLIKKNGRDIIILDEKSLICRAENCLD